ncbi:MAG TPA: hypothetical protein VM912_18505 [Terriglobales bacterium]|nr:hypothetical protein [Terriglobales bacterium]
MKPHSVFLRKGCILPNPLDPIRASIDDNWARVEDLPAQLFSTMIRQAGWRLMRTENFCSRKGVGISRQNATRHALARALQGVAHRFNAAELYSLQVANYLGFYVATVTLQPRLVQR